MGRESYHDFLRHFLTDGDTGLFHLDDDIAPDGVDYGHIGADLITMCSILRILVCMHNVEDEQIFRPAAWNAFGMDKEGADFRACKNYGPIYK